jgi:ADP-heptose:LPS heptosyltransferase
LVSVQPGGSRLLITRHDKIGDFVLALPLCKAIKTAHPEIQLSVLVSKVNFDFAKALDFIDDVILYGENFNETLAQIRQRKFDASISCFIDTQLGWLLWRAGISKRIAPATKFAQVFFNERITQRRSQVEKTEWQYNLDLGRALFANETLSFTPPLIRFEGLAPKNRVVFHPGFGGSSDGNLKIEDYLRLARAVSGTVPDTPQVVFTFGPDDQKTHDEIASKLDFPATLIKSRMSLIEFCRFLSESRLFVSTSTGPMHLAGAVNTPTISFFGESLFASSKRWATVSEPTRQHNFMLGPHYPRETVDAIEAEMLRALEQEAAP